MIPCVSLGRHFLVVKSIGGMPRFLRSGSKEGGTKDAQYKLPSQYRSNKRPASTATIDVFFPTTREVFEVCCHCKAFNKTVGWTELTITSCPSIYVGNVTTNTLS